MSISDAEREARRDDVITAMGGAASRSTLILGLGLTVDVEDQFLLYNAVLCYVSGADAGAIFCAHASCERDLSAMVAHLDDPPAGAERWGLGALVGHCRSAGLLGAELLDSLGELNERRKNLYHYGHSDSERGLGARSGQMLEREGTSGLREEFVARHGYEGGIKDIWRLAIDRVVQRDALAAITAAFRLRWWLVDHEESGHPSVAESG